MRNKWKNQIKVIGYLALIMLLLLISLPLSGVFAESEGVFIAKDMAEMDAGEDITEEHMTEMSTVEVFITEEFTTEEETSVEQQTSDTPLAILDAYLFGGNETVTVTRNDGTVINQGTAFSREYSVTLDNYHDCTENLEGNHLLQATYTVYLGDTILQSGALMLGDVGGDSFQVEYTQTGEYTIEIKASAYEERNGEYIGVPDKLLSTVTDSVEKTRLQIQGSIEKEGHFSYREDYGRSVALSFFMEEYQAENDGDISFTISSGNEAVIKLQKNQEVFSLTDRNAAFVITGAGQTELTIQPMDHDFFIINKLVIPITVENSAMRDEDYDILYTDIDGKKTAFSGKFEKWQEFLEQKKNWLNGSISIHLSEIGEQSYTGLGMTAGQEADVTAEEKQLNILEESPIQQYAFWCSNLQNNAVTKSVEKGIRTFEVGIDKTAPEKIEITYNQNAYEPTSTEKTKFYGESFVISGSFQDMLSGVAVIEYTTEADRGDEAEWNKIEAVAKDENIASFELILDKGIFTGIAIRATDLAGNTSEPVEIKNPAGEYLEIIVDKTQPFLSIVSKTADEKRYQGEWTNQPIVIVVEESLEHKTLSGIQAIQYQYVSIGGAYQSEQWEELPEEGLLKLGCEEDAKTDQNGTYYFRAITNTGIVTAIEAQKESAIRIRLQQTLAEKEKITEIAPQLEQNQVWYNKKSGVPFIQFAYPKYDNGVKSLEYDAPITVHTRLTAKFSDEKEMAPVYKTATIGIANDKVYLKLFTEEKESIEDKIEALDIDFSYDKQSGYASDGIYELEYWISDAAGNESEHDRYIYKIDTHEPEKLEILIDGTPMEAETAQTIHYDRFYQSAVSGSASADFGVSGKGIIRLMLAESVGDWEKNTNWIQSDSFALNPCTSGCIYMVAEDVAGNQSILRTQGIVVDNQPPAGENGGKFITITSKANENLFYNDNVQLRLAANDLPQSNGFSALESFSYTIGTAGKENEQRKELFSFTKALPGKEELALAKSHTTTEVIDASMYEGNDTYVEIIAKDRCGNVSTSREVLKIDVTAPKVEISFDQNEALNDRYYPMTRTATIHVQELNFDPQGIELTITKDGEAYTIPLSEWQSEGINHWATVAFAEDGDYTMTVTCTDLADNTSEEVSVEPFTIDLTKPMIEITYDNNMAANEVYYQTVRIAYITVKEHNFQKEDFVLTAEPQVSMSEWRHEGDEHQVQLRFVENNHYRFQCSYMDLAGNEAEPLEEQDFYIDSIAPQIVIRGVENESANAGEIQPVVTVYDTNSNKEAVSIQATTGMGEEIPLAIQTQEGEQGYSYILTDMSEKEDNIYFLQVTALDMAGNKSELTYRFSLNRYGSTYDLSETAQITKRVYNRSDQLSDISIMEMNVDEIEDYSIYITRNGKMLSCRETLERPQMESDKNEICYYVEETGDEKTGYRNRYVFYQENFAKEGIYRIICYSKDRAGNEMNNTREGKQAEVSFVIDNTAPKVIIDGIEAGGMYNEESQTVNIMVQDNFRLEEARFTLVNQTGNELQSWDYMELANGTGDTISITIPSLEEKQSLLYCVSDAAGNEIVLLPDSQGAPTGFLITTNPWLRFISSPVKVTVAIVVIISICGISIYFFRKAGEVVGKSKSK